MTEDIAAAIVEAKMRAGRERKDESAGAKELERPSGMGAREWLARVVLTHALSPTRPIDLTDEAATRALVRELVLPGLIGPHTAT